VRVAPRVAGAADRNELAGRPLPAQGELTAAFRRCGPSDLGAMAAAGARHDTEIVGPPLSANDNVCFLDPSGSSAARGRSGRASRRTSLGWSNEARRLTVTGATRPAPGFVWRVCAELVASMWLTCLRRSPKESRSKAAWPSGRVEGESEVGRLVHFARFGVELECDLRPGLLRRCRQRRVWSRWCRRDTAPRFEATRLRQVWPLMVIATPGRFPLSSASTTSAGTSAPVAFPAATTLARKAWACIGPPLGAVGLP
jgi:hypothetical protein